MIRLLQLTSHSIFQLTSKSIFQLTPSNSIYQEHNFNLRTIDEGKTCFLFVCKPTMGYP